MRLRAHRPPVHSALVQERLLEGVRVVDLGGDPSARAGRVLGDLGACVVRVVPPDGRRAHGQRRPGVERGQGRADAGAPTTPELDDAAGRRRRRVRHAARRRHASCSTRAARRTRSGCTSRRSASTGRGASWRASDLGVMAASGNMFCTGDPDRAPVRCTEPTAHAHSGPEAAFAALTALWHGVPQTVDVSMQEVVIDREHGRARDGSRQTGFRGERRGANIGRTREIWPTTDGFVSFGLRGGKARVASLELIAKLAELPDRDWNEFNAEHRERRRAERDRREGRRVLRAAHDARAVRHRVRDEPDARADQLAPRDRTRRRSSRRASSSVPSTTSSASLVRSCWSPAPTAKPPPRGRKVTQLLGEKTPPEGGFRTKQLGEKAWDGLKILEFGSGAAGPIATRYFVEHGATVLRIESKCARRLPAHDGARGRATRTGSKARRCTTG